MQQQQHEQHHRRRRRGNGSGASPTPGATVQPVSQAPKNATEREPQHGQSRAEQKARQPRDNQQRPRTAPPAPAEQSQQGGAERQQQRHNNRGNRGPRAVTDSAASPQQQQQQQQQRPPRQQAQQQQQPAKVDEYGNPIRARGKKGAKNTENFVPSHDPPAMRVVVDPHPTESQVRLTTLDVTLHPCVFSQPGDESIYARLVAEIDACTIPQERMLKSWHGDSHWIADDHTGWKKQVPTFTHVVERLQKYFSNSKQKFKINATRLNWYKDSEEWKPFHHDAAAVKPDIARIQNFTVAVSFGVTREAAFEDVLSKRIISFVVPDGSIYTFARDINITWKHGIVQPKPGTHQHHIAQGGRISIIAWGWLDQDEM